jgi:hypothetical protein
MLFRLLIALLGLLCVAALVTRAADQPRQAEATLGKLRLGDERGEQLYHFSMDNKPWRDLIDWLADHSGLAYASNYKPAVGTFTFIAPKGRLYTLSEIFSIVNEVLQSDSPNGYVLFRRRFTFRSAPTDEKIPQRELALISLDEMKARGPHEPVKVALPLSTLAATDIVPRVEKLLSPFGSVTVSSEANQLVVLDTVGKLREIRRMIKDAEAREANKQRDAKGK